MGLIMFLLILGNICCGVGRICYLAYGDEIRITKEEITVLQIVSILLLFPGYILGSLLYKILLYKPFKGSKNV